MAICRSTLVSTADTWIEKMRYIHTMKYYSSFKKENFVTCYNMGTSWGYYAKWIKPEQRLYDPFTSDIWSGQPCKSEKRMTLATGLGWQGNTKVAIQWVYSFHQAIWKSSRNLLQKYSYSWFNVICLFTKKYNIEKEYSFAHICIHISNYYPVLLLS